MWQITQNRANLFRGNKSGQLIRDYLTFDLIKEAHIMLKFIENLLSAFRSCFSRTRTYEWFLIIVSALFVRYDSL